MFCAAKEAARKGTRFVPGNKKSCKFSLSAQRMIIKNNNKQTNKKTEIIKISSVCKHSVLRSGAPHNLRAVEEGWEQQSPLLPVQKQGPKQGTATGLSMSRLQHQGRVLTGQSGLGVGIALMRQVSAATQTKREPRYFKKMMKVNLKDSWGSFI